MSSNLTLGIKDASDVFIFNTFIMLVQQLPPDWLYIHNVFFCNTKIIAGKEVCKTWERRGMKTSKAFTWKWLQMKRSISNTITDAIIKSKFFTELLWNEPQVLESLHCTILLKCSSKCTFQGRGWEFQSERHYERKRSIRNWSNTLQCDQKVLENVWKTEDDGETYDGCCRHCHPTLTIFDNIQDQIYIFNFHVTGFNHHKTAFVIHVHCFKRGDNFITDSTMYACMKHLD